jgi:hypothetical protein
VTKGSYPQQENEDKPNNTATMNAAPTASNDHEPLWLHHYYDSFRSVYR